MSVQMSPKLYFFLKKKALKVGMSFEEYLKVCHGYETEVQEVEEETEVQEVEEEKLHRWEEDLQELASQQDENTSQTEALKAQSDELPSQGVSDDPTLGDYTSPAPSSDEPPLQPEPNTASTLKDQEVSSVVINGFGILSGCQAQPGLLTNLYGTESCANWPSFQDTTPVRKITGNALNEVSDMERDYEYVTLPEDLYNWINEKAQLAGMSFEDYLEVTSGFREEEQAAQKKLNLFQKRRATKPKARSKRGFG